MANEYTWNGDADVDTATLVDFIATINGGEVSSDGTVFLAGMYVNARHVEGEDVNPDMHLLGFEHRFTATFRFANLADEATTEHATALMVNTLVAFSSQHGGRGVLLYNGDVAILQYADRDIVFDAEWEDWSDNSEVAPLLSRFKTKALPQPLL